MTTERNKKYRELQIPQILHRFSINKNKVFQFDPNNIEISSIENHQFKKMYWPLAKSHKIIPHELSQKELVDDQILQIGGIQQKKRKSKLKSSKSQKKSDDKKSQNKQKNYLNLPSIKRKNMSADKKTIKNLEQYQNQRLYYIFGKNQRIKNSHKLLGTIQPSLNKSKSRKQLPKSQKKQKRHNFRNNVFLQKLQLSGKHMIGVQKYYEKNFTIAMDERYTQKVNLLPSQLLFGNKRQDIIKNVFKNILKLT